MKSINLYIILLFSCAFTIIIIAESKRHYLKQTILIIEDINYQKDTISIIYYDSYRIDNHIITDNVFHDTLLTNINRFRVLKTNKLN